MTLVEFLLARIAEDAQWATLSASPDYADAEEGTPAWSGRILAECEAKRRMLPYLYLDDPSSGLIHPLDHCDRCSVLRLLVLPYAAHPDFDPAWAL